MQRRRRLITGGGFPTSEYFPSSDPGRGWSAPGGPGSSSDASDGADDGADTQESLGGLGGLLAADRSRLAGMRGAAMTNLLLNLICLGIGLLLGGALVARWSRLRSTEEQIKRLDRETARQNAIAAIERRRAEALEHINLNTLSPHWIDVEDL